MLEAVLDEHRGGTRVTTHFVQGADPGLRDREVQRLVDELLGTEDRTLALEDHTIPSRRRSASDDDAAPEPEGDGTSIDVPAFTAVTNALQSPPFMTAYRVVVVREIGNLTTDQAKWLAAWITAGSDETRLVLVAGGGRTPPSIDKAAKAHATVVAPATEQTAGVLAAQLKAAGVRLAPDASARLVEHLGEDAGRVPELVEVLQSTYGSGVTLGVDDVEVYLGDVGTAGRFDLTNAIDRGDVADRARRAQPPAHRDEHARTEAVAPAPGDGDARVPLPTAAATRRSVDHDQGTGGRGARHAQRGRGPVPARSVEAAGVRRAAGCAAAARAGRARPARVRRTRRADGDRRARRAAGGAQPPALTGDAGPSRR